MGMVLGQTFGTSNHDTNLTLASYASLHFGNINTTDKIKDTTANLQPPINSLAKNSPAKVGDTTANPPPPYRAINSFAKRSPAKADSVKLPVYGSAIKPKQH